MKISPLSKVALYKGIAKASGLRSEKPAQVISPLIPKGILAPDGRISQPYVEPFASKLVATGEVDLDAAKLAQTLQQDNLVATEDFGHSYQAMVSERDAFKRLRILKRYVSQFNLDPNKNRRIATDCLLETFSFRTTQVFTVDREKETWLHRYSAGEKLDTPYPEASVPPERSVDDFVTGLIRSEIPADRLEAEQEKGLYELQQNGEWSYLHIPDLRRFKKALNEDSADIPSSGKPEEANYLIFGRPEDTYFNVYVAYQRPETLLLKLDEESYKMLIENFASFLSPARKLEYAHKQIQIASITDGLTGLFNRTTFFERLEHEFARAKRHGYPLSVLMIDADDFKLVNDTYGHPAGDIVIRGIARKIKETVRKIDIPARYGGEEFAVILPDTDENGSFKLAKRLRREVSGAVFKINNGQEKKVTVSVGVTTYNPNDNRIEKADEIVELADQALRSAKDLGKNQVVVAHLPNPG